VFAWRTLQEHRLRERTGAGMTDQEVGRFIRHYERLTRHILAEMPGRADAVIPIAPDHQMVEAIFRHDGALTRP
jgi:D-glycerate 3-kinase